MKKKSKVKIINKDYGFSEEVYNNVYTIIDIDYSLGEAMFVLDSPTDGKNNQYYDWELQEVFNIK